LSTVALFSETPAAPARVLPRFVREVAEEAGSVRLEPVRRLPPPARDAVVLLSVIRNEAAVVGDFLAHHRRVGVDRFVVLDNGSTDGTAERLAAEPDVDLYLVRRRFLPPLKQGWINRAIAEYGHDRWYAYADADEHLVFDGCEDGGLGGLIAHAGRRGLRRVRGMLVDMYAPGPLLGPELGPELGPALGRELGTRRAPGGRRAVPLAEAFPLFDSDSYRETLCKQRISRQGGPRWRRFWRDGIAPELTKYPLFHIREGEIFDNPHHLYPYGRNFESPCLVGILHFKFDERFLGKIEDALEHEQYFDGSAEYKHYRRVLGEDRGLALDYPGSRRYRTPADLVACGLIEPTRADAPPLRREGGSLAPRLPA
jgi:Glycosyl transferase family 2